MCVRGRKKKRESGAKKGLFWKHLFAYGREETLFLFKISDDEKCDGDKGELGVY